jgi:glucosamine 6-phosphate synthetase-like amidotransferase/phosphosugar isomerase protein
MCGIAGFCINEKEHIDARALAGSLLHQIVERGTDATGMAWFDKKENKVKYSRWNKPAPLFVATRLQNMGSNTKNCILHTRYATQGSPKNMDNNHPIVCKNIVGVHNGHISNDKEIFKEHKMFRKGQVDSEAIFALLNKYDEVPATDSLLELDGRAAVAWIDRRKPRTLTVARVTSSPLAVAQTVAGSFIFASTESLLVKACDNVNLELEWVVNMNEYELMTVRNGRVQQYESFTPTHVKPKVDIDWSTFDSDEYGMLKSEAWGQLKLAK